MAQAIPPDAGARRPPRPAPRAARTPSPDQHIARRDDDGRWVVLGWCDAAQRWEPIAHVGSLEELADLLEALEGSDRRAA